MKESDFQHQVIQDLKKRFPECIILKNDPTYCQGIPDLSIFWEDHWATLEVKKSKNDFLHHKQPNQEWYVTLMNNMSFSAFIYPENKEEVLEELEMIWNSHPEIPDGSHAFLSASKYSWLNYDNEKLRQTYLNHLATLKGTETHDFASRCIKFGQKLEDKPLTLNMFVNDCIDLMLQSEQVLKYSEFCFGTADAIGLDEMDILHVFDLKTGAHKTCFPQLEIYSALFCLEYDIPVKHICGFDLRIYQHNDKKIYTPTRDRISFVCDKIIEADKILREMEVV